MLCDRSTGCILVSQCPWWYSVVGAKTKGISLLYHCESYWECNSTTEWNEREHVVEGRAQALRLSGVKCPLERNIENHHFRTETSHSRKRHIPWIHDIGRDYNNLPGTRIFYFRNACFEIGTTERATVQLATETTLTVRLKLVHHVLNFAFLVDCLLWHWSNIWDVGVELPKEIYILSVNDE